MISRFMQKGEGTRLLRAVARRAPILGPTLATVQRGRRAIEDDRVAPQFVRPGHFYSPIPPLAQLHEDAGAIFSMPRELPGIDLREREQLELLEALSAYYRDQPFPEQPSAETRYYLSNGAYEYSDGLLLHAMIRHVKPAQIIEIGSGFSSCVMLDTNERFLGGSVDLTFVDPYPAQLRALLRPGDEQRVRIVQARAQDLPLDQLRELRAGSILFIDSTHVSRAGSDVNHLIFKVLPVLQPGVLVHFHDIFYPFEYPRAWLLQGRTWTEAYVLRAFMQFNDSFEIVLFNTFLEHFHEAFFERHMPLCLKNRGGSLWLRKRR